MENNFLYIANWKAYLNHTQGKNLLTAYISAFNNGSKHLIICPDATLASHAQGTASPAMRIGAQDCSPYTCGAHTGDITAATLASCGVSFCIVGHWERVQRGETVDITALKVKRLLEQKITPIICVTNHFETKLAALYDQITKNDGDIVIAYEPADAIGTHILPSYDAIHQTLATLQALCKKLDAQRTVKLVYGGSVNSANASELKKIPLLNGLLIGKASIDFQEFKKIVEC